MLDLLSKATGFVLCAVQEQHSQSVFLSCSGITPGPIVSTFVPDVFLAILRLLSKRSAETFLSIQLLKKKKM